MGKILGGTNLNFVKNQNFSLSTRVFKSIDHTYTSKCSGLTSRNHSTKDTPALLTSTWIGPYPSIALLVASQSTRTAQIVEIIGDSAAKSYSDCDLDNASTFSAPLLAKATATW